jgi:hypothetical protein
MELTAFINHPERLDRDTLYELRSMLALNPYFQTARLLMLQNLYLLHDSAFDEELRRAALYITDRKVIFNMVEAAHYQLRKQAPLAATQTQAQTGSTSRTIDLIDTFLDSIPADEEQKETKRRPTPADAAIDYVAYLLESETDAPADENPDADSAESTGEEGSEGDTGDLGAPENAGDPSSDVTVEPEAPEGPEQKPEDVNAESQPASISADALIKELIDLKYPEKIRVVAQQMKQTSKGSAPTANDMVRPVAQAISRYMAKKGYAAMAKDEAIRVVKTIVMAATDVGKSKQKQD